MATRTRTQGAGDVVRVLVVDESEIAAGFVADALAFAEPALAVESTVDHEGALERLRDERFDCIVSEYTLEDEDGLAFLDRASDVAPDVRGIVLTIEDDPAVAERAWERGFAYARKGHDLDRYGVIARHIVGSDEDTEV